jgi:hypothetical protein
MESAMKKTAAIPFCFLLLCPSTGSPQVGTAFTYQGRLTDAGSPPSGAYDFEFQLFTLAVGGTGSNVQTLGDVAVTNGLFTVALDFGPAFTGSQRWLEVRVRPGASIGAYTALSPRQELTPTPNALWSASAAAVTGIVGVANGGTGSATQNFVDLTTAQTVGGDKTLTGNLDVGASTATTGNIMKGPDLFIHNFGALNTFIGANAGNLTMTGSGNTASGATALSLNATGSNNTASGVAALQSNTTAGGNVAIGVGALQTQSFDNSGIPWESANTAVGFQTLQSNQPTYVFGSGYSGSRNTAIGSNGLQSNTTGRANTASGHGALQNNTTGDDNTASGIFALWTNTTGSGNVANGSNALVRNTTGQINTASGDSALWQNTTGFGNTAAGDSALGSNISGNSNTAIGWRADVTSGALSNATAIGANAIVSQSNSLVLGNAANVGIGTSAPNFKLHVVGQNLRVEGDTASVLPRFSLNFTGGGADAKKWQNYATTNTLVFSALNDAENSEGSWLQVNRAGTTISGVVFPFGNVAIGIASTPDKLGVNGTISVGALGAAGATALCRNAANQISNCSSSARYKSDVHAFRSGLSLIRQLRPVSFNWKDGGMADMGLVAEEVNAVEPLLTTNNASGEIEGVKYDRIGVVLVNAIQEQQAQLEEQAKRNEGLQGKIEALERRNLSQQTQIERLIKVLCSRAVEVEGCKAVALPN